MAGVVPIKLESMLQQQLQHVSLLKGTTDGPVLAVDRHHNLAPRQNEQVRLHALLRVLTRINGKAFFEVVTKLRSRRRKRRYRDAGLISYCLATFCRHELEQLPLPDLGFPDEVADCPQISNVESRNDCARIDMGSFPEGHLEQVEYCVEMLQ